MGCLLERQQEGQFLLAQAIVPARGGQDSTNSPWLEGANSGGTGALACPARRDAFYGAAADASGGRGHTVFANSSSFQSKAIAPSFTNRLTKFSTLRAYISLACTAPMLARLSGPATTTPLLSMVCPGRVSSQLPSVSAARSTITLPGFIPLTIAAVTIFGAGRPGTAAVQTITSTVLR